MHKHVGSCQVSLVQKMTNLKLFLESRFAILNGTHVAHMNSCIHDGKRSVSTNKILGQSLMNINILQL